MKRMKLKVCEHIEIDHPTYDAPLPDTTNMETVDITCVQCDKTFHFIFEAEPTNGHKTS